MPRRLSSITYLCPRVSRPTGGVNVIFRHSRMIEEARFGGVSSAVHFPDMHDPAPLAAENGLRLKPDGRFNRAGDLIVIPEVMAEPYGPMLMRLGVSYAIFVQNGYYTLVGAEADRQAIERRGRSYAGATMILSISDDTTDCIVSLFPAVRERILKLQYSVNPTLFHPAGPKQNVITYMPRKLPTHSQAVVAHLLAQGLGDWIIQPIDGVDENGVAEMLRGSRIFMAFSELEGCPVPPVEAGMAGNRVIGYTGEGGKEYWSEPLFTEVSSGDILGFAAAVRSEVRRLSNESSDDTRRRLAPAVSAITDRYSPASERAVLEHFVTTIAEAFAENEVPFPAGQ